MFNNRRPVFDMDRHIAAVVRRFPSRRQAIEELAARDPEFLSLCTDLADAEAAQHRWENRIDPKRDERSAEYRALADDLALEVGEVLNSAEIIPLINRRSKLKP
jgi:hypothetical protein